MKAVVVALAGALAVAGGAEGLDGFRYRRQIEVEQPGWVGVRLTAEASRFLAADLTLLAPNGEPLPFQRLPPAATDGRRSVTVTGVRRTAAGWQVTMDLGPHPPVHTRLHFVLAEKTTAERCLLEGSDDGASWESLGVGDLFQLGAGDELGKTLLDYAESQHRYLRLHWPAVARFPAVERAEVTTLGDASALLRLAPPSCRAVGRGALCEVALPVPPRLVRRLDLAPRTAGRLGLRLAVGEGGRWRLLAERTFDAGGERGLRLPLELSGDAPAALRLELYGEAEPPTLAEDPSVLLARESVVFEAPESGAYTLAYGGATPVPRTAIPAGPPPRARLAWIEPGPLTTAPWPPFPAAVAGPGAPLPEAGFRRRWGVRSAASAGEVVRLALPPPVYAAARADLADLRLEASGHQLPYVRRRLAEPTSAGRHEALHPAAVRGRRSSRFEIELDAALPLTALDLASTTAPFERPMRGWFEQPARPGLDGRQIPAFGGERWRCFDADPLPCRLALTLPARPGGDRLTVELDDGDDPPLGAVDAELWRAQDALDFVWPAAGPVRLHAGADLPPPDYDLAALGGQLLARPRRAAALEAASEGAAAAEGWTRWALLGSFLLAGIVLLVLLARLVPRGDGGGD